MEKSENIGAKIRKLNGEGGASSVRVMYQLMTVSGSTCQPPSPLFEKCSYLACYEALWLGIFRVREFAKPRIVRKGKKGGGGDLLNDARARLAAAPKVCTTRSVRMTTLPMMKRNLEKNEGSLARL